MFQTLMDVIFRPNLDKFIPVHLDDVLVHGKAKHDHFEHLTKALRKLKYTKYTVKRQIAIFLRIGSNI